MRRKIKLAGLIYVCVMIVAFVIAKPVSIIMFFLLLCGAFLGGIVLMLNKAYKRTNHWNNWFAFQNNFITNIGYRDNLSRNFDIANLGSNPALFGFFYEKIRGANWSTGSQGLEMDFEILRYYHSYLHEGGYVLIPIMPFTAISQYLKTKAGYWNDRYYMKFASIIDGYQTSKMPGGKLLLYKLRYPILFFPKFIIYLFKDVEKDKRIFVTEQSMSKLQLEQDATNWINSWKQEFDMKDLNAVYDDKFSEFFSEGTQIIRSIISFCIERNLKPILITIPMSSYLGQKFSDDFIEKMVVEFVERSNEKNVPFLNYMFDERFTDASLYNGSFFLNLKGRKIFTDQVLKDIGVGVDIEEL